MRTGAKTPIGQRNYSETTCVLCGQPFEPNGPREYLNSPPALVAIARAAHAVGDRDLERAAKTELVESFGITIRFSRPKPKSDGAQK
jgi:hypothetical protein